MSKQKIGTGKRFKAGVEKLKQKGFSEQRAKAIMASAGRKKYGQKKMTAMSTAGRKRAKKRRLSGLAFFKKKAKERKDFARKKDIAIQNLTPEKMEKVKAYEKKNHDSLIKAYNHYKSMIKHGLISHQREMDYQKYVIGRWVEQNY